MTALEEKAKIKKQTYIFICSHQESSPGALLAFRRSALHLLLSSVSSYNTVYATAQEHQ